MIIINGRGETNRTAGLSLQLLKNINIYFSKKQFSDCLLNEYRWRPKSATCFYAIDQGFQKPDAELIPLTFIP